MVFSRSVYCFTHDGFLDTQLLGEIIDQLRRHVERVGQEHAQLAHRHDLEREAQPVVVAAPRRDQPPVLVVQVKNRSSSTREYAPNRP